MKVRMIPAGSQRITRHFAWFPVTMSRADVRVWLEPYYIVQSYDKVHACEMCSHELTYWTNREYITVEEYHNMKLNEKLRRNEAEDTEDLRG